MSQTIDETTNDPNLLTTSLTGSLVRGTATEVTLSARQHTFTIDEPAGLGGTDLGANPVEHLLGALASCTVITYQVWAEKLGLRLDGVDVALAGDIDLRGFFGTAEGVRPGFRGIDLEVTLTGPESDADYRRLEEAVATHCPVADNLTNGVPVRTTLELAAG
ncbi:OsmC family protein [Janibacter cremeus]|uniref:OsmC family protein n=1 Tax=Janibacter cremeus TaxID=1285192 RepID=UPI0023F77AC8|nr:OsmC family protein [Janibacter cremeus]WEV77166.1 OsmC family protein [Janibacter cremeus]